ncbi:MAG TPA: hypothetical protein VH988_07895 [Thermoanaerobaculia bacterium]|jgi:hypothetical protein|nr:hypothetical protein [Thermoanaerobaculia bacterium]
MQPESLPGPTHPQILTSADAAWRFLEHEGGLDADFYDAATVTELRASLSLPADETVSDALARRAVPVEDFVAAFFKAVAPYAEMMNDLLNLFTRAGAQRSNHNLRLDFDFGRNIKLDFDLNQFRDWLAVWERVSAATQVAQWDYHALWDLYSALRIERPQENDDPQLMGAAGTGAEAWAREYMAGRWPRIALPAPTSGMPGLDRALERAWRLWSAIVQESTRVSSDREQLREFRQRVQTEDREGEPQALWNPRFLSILDSDHWAASVAAGLYGTAEEARRMIPGEEREDFARRRLATLDELFARQPVVVVEAGSWAQILRDFLNLPVWQQRHELYGAWVWTQMLAALGGFACRIHQENGTIHFSFAGSHLATFPRLDPALHIWAELRSPLTETPWGKGRRGKIQPDYTLLHDPITSRDSAVLVVECKQYRAASTRNFIAALVDYARGRPTAIIVLVNYGPAPQAILEESPAEIRDRLVLIGDMRPRGLGVESFHETVRSAVARRFPVGEAPPAFDPTMAAAATGSLAVEKVVLTWAEFPRDLDLYLISNAGGAETRIFYGNHGSLSQPPWAELDRDARFGSGPESITISRLSGRYRCYVHNYSGEVPLSDSMATIVIIQQQGNLKLTCPREGIGRYWHAFNLDTATGAIEVVNRMTDSVPS